VTVLITGGMGFTGLHTARAFLDAGQDVVIVWGERMGGAPGGADALRALLNVAGNLKLGEHEGAGLLAIPAVTNGRGLREAGVLPNAGPGLKAPVADGRGAPEIAAALADGDLRALYLLGADPLVSYPGRGAWAKALDRATTVVAHAGVLTQGIREHADVVFPSEVYAEKNGTVVHPDGRQASRPLQPPARIRRGIDLCPSVIRGGGRSRDGSPKRPRK